MGKLIVMPSSGMASETKPEPKSQKSHRAVTKRAKNSKLRKNSKRARQVDFSVWLDAPRERTPEYFPTYSAVSKAIQTAIRGWVREWFLQNMEILKRPHHAYSLLVYQCTHPFSGRPTNIFTYEIQQTETVHRAFRSAANKMGRYLRSLNTKSLSWFRRQQYFAYKSDQVIEHVYRNPRSLYRMLHVETLLVDAILRFSIIDLPEIGMEESLERLQRTFRVQLHRFSEQFDLSPRSEELLRIATEALVAKMSADAEPLPWGEAA